MMYKIGEEFAGVISAVTSFGFFVELQGIYVEGLVHIAALQQDYFHYDALSHHLRGERTGVRFRLGDRVQIRVVRVNLDDKKIDFELVDGKQKSSKSGSTSTKSKVVADKKAKSGKTTANKPKTKSIDKGKAKKRSKQ